MRGYLRFRMLVSFHALPNIDFFLSVILLFSVACNQRTNTLTIFAATSLTDAQEELAHTFEEANPGLTVKVNFASSSTLATQIIEGARADIFASANAFQMDRVAERGLIHGKARNFVSNRVVLIVPASNPAKIQSLDDLALPELRLVLALPGTPIRAYTDYLLNAAAQERQKGFLVSVHANIKSEEANVRLVLSKVILGEADAAFVYQSDVTPDVIDELIIIPTPEKYQSEIVYPIAVLSVTKRVQLADSYLDFVLSPEGQSILAKWRLVPIAASDN